MIKKSFCLAIAILLVCGFMLAGCTTKTQGNKNQETTQTAKTIEEQVASDQNVVWVEYNNLKECKEKYTKDMETMNGLLPSADIEIVLMDIQSKDPIQVDDSKIEATYRKIDKSKYILKTYTSTEESKILVQNDLKQLNETAQAGDAYKVDKAEAIPFDAGVRIYFEKVELS